MSTTNMFIELLIIGFEAMVWFTLLVSNLFGLDWLPKFDQVLAKAEVLVIAILFGFTYLLGIIVDGIADALTEKWEERIWQAVRGAGEMSKLDTYAQAVSSVEVADAIFQYPRSRIRILRASIFNLALVSVLALLLIWTRLALQPRFKLGLSLFVGIAGVVIVGLVTFAYRHLEFCYWEMVKSFYLSGRKSRDQE